jgi:hypothetical protein
VGVGGGCSERWCFAVRLLSRNRMFGTGEDFGSWVWFVGVY